VEGSTNMKLVLFGLSFSILLGLPDRASAQPESGHKLYSECQAYEFSQANPDAHLSGNQMYDSAFCMGYVTGVVDAQDRSLYDVPTGTTMRQILDIVYKYLADHPESRDFGAAFLIAQAMRKTYGKKQEIN
jgi:Rap1a immunity proteins